jgi:hypothetical protein
VRFMPTHGIPGQPPLNQNKVTTLGMGCGVYMTRCKK